MTTEITPMDERELVLTRLVDVPAEKLYRCWTEPALLTQWFAPLPWTTPHAELDVRAGGANRITMRSPEGEDMPNEGIYLEVVPNQKLVITDAFRAGWMPTAAAFMVIVLTFTPEDGKTRYIARARHWTKEAAEQHEQMGFHTGWGICADQLVALAKTL
ncbi:MAG: SRPBCC family protein [Sandaracinaceae bacterium]|nr:SRPBCC family protein [Sandaracinaceae bacterium]